jgi:hypothetical protein
VNPIEQVIVACQSLAHAARRSMVPGLWVPWIVFAALETLILIALVGFAHPLISGLMAPLILRLGGEEALHYPGLLDRLPDLFARLDGLYAAIAAPIAFGAAVTLFVSVFPAPGSTADSRVRPGEALRRALGRIVPLVVTQLPVPLFTFAVGWTLGRVLGVHAIVGLKGALFLVGVTIAPILARAFFLYAGTLVILDGYGTLDTFLELPRAWSRGLWAALFLVIVLSIPLLPIPLLCSRPLPATPLGPELKAVLLAAQIVIGAVVWFLLAGGATLLHLSLVADQE